MNEKEEQGNLIGSPSMSVGFRKTQSALGSRFRSSVLSDLWKQTLQLRESYTAGMVTPAGVQGDFSTKLAHPQHILLKICRVWIYISIGLHNTNIHMHE